MTDLSITRGDTRTFTHTITRSAVAVDLTGATLSFMVKTDAYQADVDAVITKTIGSGIVVSAPATGVAVTTVLPANTSGLAAGRLDYIWELVMTEANGVVTTVERGAFVISAG
jgi:hypothetical protein